MLAALANVLRVPELRRRVIFTLVMFAVFRLGTHIPVPGVNAAMIEQLFNNGNLFGLLDLFSGGALSKFSIFAMSITPYINASIILQLLKVVIPTLEEWSKEGQEGYKKINKVTRYLTVVLAAVQGFGMAFGLRSAINNPNVKIKDLQLTRSRAEMASWPEGKFLVDTINAHSFVVAQRDTVFAEALVNADALLPDGISTLAKYLNVGTINILNVILFLLIALAMVVFVVAISQGVRKIPVQYSKRIVGRKMYGGHSSYIPLKVNQAGVIPIIFASSLLMLPATIGQFVKVPWVQKIAGYFAWGTPLQTALYIILIIFFTFFYTAVTLDIKNMSENIKKMGGFIPGLRPGKPTTDYLDNVMTRITLSGAIFLALIAMMPHIIVYLTGIEGIYIGGTSLLIVVGVALDTMKQIESLALVRHYQGFMK